MSHEVESMFSVRQVPWHGLGTILPDYPQSVDEVLSAAGLDWTVEMQGAVTTSGISLPNVWAVIRSSDQSILGMHTSRYRPQQPRELVDFLWTLAEPGIPTGERVQIETAASLAEGRKMFVCARVPRDIMIGGIDEVNMYIVVSSSHDGSLAFSAAVTPVRTVCANTLNLGLQRAKSMWKIKHTESMSGKVAEAREALGMTFTYADEFEVAMNALLDQEFTKRDFESMVKAVFPAKKLDGLTAFTPEQYQMIGVFESSPTLDDSIRNTKWGALNAVREWDDWHPIQRSTSTPDAERRTDAALWGSNVQRSDKVFAYLTQ